MTDLFFREILHRMCVRYVHCVIGMACGCTLTQVCARKTRPHPGNDPAV